MSSGSNTGRRVLVLDTMCLSQFARMDRLDVLGHLLIDWDCWTTSIVIDELRRGSSELPELNAACELDWLTVAAFETDDEIVRLVEWMALVSADGRGEGEASVFAAAQLRDGIAVTDDRKATQVAKASWR